MKKAIVLLLALAMVGGAAFAQSKVSVSLDGSVTIFDQDFNSVLKPSGNGYDTVTIKGASEDGTYGFSITDQNILDGAFPDAASIRDWNVYYKLFDGLARVTFGKLRNGDVRLTLPNWEVDGLGGTDRISGEGVLFNVYPMDGLTVAYNLPVATTAATIGNVFQASDIGVKYDITDLGTAILLVNLNIPASSNVINAGFKFTAVENLTATVLYKGTLATASTHAFAVGGSYKLDALSAGLEFAGAYGTAFTWDLAALGKYQITDEIYAGALFKFNSASAYDGSAYAAYDFGNGLQTKLSAGYNGALYYNMKLLYSVSF